MDTASELEMGENLAQKSLRLVLKILIFANFCQQNQISTVINPVMIEMFLFGRYGAIPTQTFNFVFLSTQSGPAIYNISYNSSYVHIQYNAFTTSYHALMKPEF